MAVFKCDGACNGLVGKGNIGVAFLDPDTTSGTFVGEEHDTAIGAIGTIHTAGAIGGLVGVVVCILEVGAGMGSPFFVNHCLHLVDEGLVVYLVGLRRGKADLGRKSGSRVAAVAGGNSIVNI